MSVTETQRNPKTSLVKVETISGAAIPSVMFALRGFYEMAKARRAPYFVELNETDQGGRTSISLVGFSNSKTIDPQRYFGLDKPVTGEGKPHFWSTRELDLIFRRR